MFQLKDVSLVYDMGKEDVTYALRNINLEVENKGLVGIIGPSGSGKSSILYVMAGLKNATSGSITYMGRTFKEMSIDSRADLRLKEFGFIFQRGFLIEYLSVIDNVLVPVNKKSKALKVKAEELLERLGIGGLKNKKPYQLSGGQRQRAVMARALINEPQVVFADEPTSALDHKSASEVMSLLAEYSKEKLVITVTHDTSILKDAHRVISMWDGCIPRSDQEYLKTGDRGDEK